MNAVALPAVDLGGPQRGNARHRVEREIEGLFRLDDEDAVELLLIRHAEPAAEGLNDDPLLSCNGLQQAERLAGRLQDAWVDAIYAAPERRAVQTALIASQAIGRQLTTVEGLRDIDFQPDEAEAGSTRGATYAHRFYADPHWEALPGFAPGKAFRERSLRAVEQSIASHPGRRIAVIVHASTINAYLGALLTLQGDVFFAPDHASVSIVRSLGDLHAVRALNDISHLGGCLRED